MLQRSSGVRYGGRGCSAVELLLGLRGPLDGFTCPSRCHFILITFTPTFRERHRADRRALFCAESSFCLRSAEAELWEEPRFSAGDVSGSLDQDPQIRLNPILFSGGYLDSQTFRCRCKWWFSCGSNLLLIAKSKVELDIVFASLSVPMMKKPQYSLNRFIETGLLTPT